MPRGGCCGSPLLLQHDPGFAAGGNFSVGADISEFEGIRVDRQRSAEYEVAVDSCSSAIAGLGKPVIAAISGYCLGGGCHLALACDFRFADRTAMVGIPAAKLSIVYGVRSVQRLLALASMANAKRILHSGERYDARRARSLDCSTRSMTPAQRMSGPRSCCFDWSLF